MKTILNKIILYIPKAIKTFLYGELTDTLKELKHDFYISEKDSLRYKILSFASSIRRGELHTTQEFETIFHFHDKYEMLIDKLGETNGFTHSEFLFIAEEYKKLKSKNSSFFV